MSPATALAAGFALGIASGTFAGRDLARSLVAPAGHALARAALGLARRLGLLGATLGIAIFLGHGAWAGAAAGYLAAFAARTAREALARGR